MASQLPVLEGLRHVDLIHFCGYPTSVEWKLTITGEPTDKSDIWEPGETFLSVFYTELIASAD